MYRNQNPVTDPAILRGILGEEFISQTRKNIDHIDDHCRVWIERSPFAIISSCDATGNMDVSPRGDPAGFVKVLDRATLAVPDRIGNHRGDTMFNVLANPAVAMVFLVPKRKEVVRVNGRAELCRDPALLETMTVNGHLPDLAIIIRVHEAFYHCGKAVIRSSLWQPEKWGPVDSLPTYGQTVKDHANLPDPIEDLDEMMAMNETDRLY